MQNKDIVKAFETKPEVLPSGDTIRERLNRDDLSIGDRLKRIALDSIKRWKMPLTPEESLKYLALAVKIRRDAAGLSRNQPSVVNIVNQQQAIINKYKKSTKKNG